MSQDLQKALWATARWETIRTQAKQADNSRLKGILVKHFGRSQLEPGKLRLPEAHEQLEDAIA